jgi:hypothetical protein
MQMNSSFESDPKDGGSARDLSPRPESVARGLGWFSVALGIAELLAPRAISRAAGMDASAGLVRLYGLRELACGVGILTSRNPAPFLWARVGGDVLDLSTLAARSNTGSGRDRRRAMRAAVNVAGVTALDVYAAQRCSAARAPSSRDYSDRTGFAQAPAQMRGAALPEFEIPRDLRAPDALLSYTRGHSIAANAESGRSRGAAPLQ